MPCIAGPSRNAAIGSETVGRCYGREDEGCRRWACPRRACAGNGPAAVTLVSCVSLRGARARVIVRNFEEAWGVRDGGCCYRR